MKKMMYLFSTLLLILAGVEPVRAQWIEPAQYQDMLGRGVDVEWWTDGNDYSSYDWDEILSDYSDAGIQHVRITLENDVLTDYDFDRLDRQVNACLRYNLVPIIAFRPRFAHGGQPVLYRNRLTSWWRIMAEHYRGYPARLSFDILIEPNSSMFATTALLNDFYEDCVSVIRVSNPYRILFIAPTYNSDPMYLRHLRIPSRHNGYLMAEWHFLSQANYERAWYNWQHRRAYEERWINQRVQAAIAWQRATGIYTWVGGWATGAWYATGYNAMQEAYTDFLCRALTAARIPFAVRGFSRYYNPAARAWHNVGHAPMRTVFPRGNFAHSGRPVGPAAPAMHPQHANRNGFSVGGHRFEQSGRPAQQPNRQRVDGRRNDNRRDNGFINNGQRRNDQNYNRGDQNYNRSEGQSQDRMQRQDNSRNSESTWRRESTRRSSEQTSRQQQTRRQTSDRVQRQENTQRQERVQRSEQTSRPQQIQRQQSQPQRSERVQQPQRQTQSQGNTQQTTNRRSGGGFSRGGNR